MAKNKKVTTHTKARKVLKVAAGRVRKSLAQAKPPSKIPRMDPPKKDAPPPKKASPKAAPPKKKKRPSLNVKKPQVACPSTPKRPSVKPPVKKPVGKPISSKKKGEDTKKIEPGVVSQPSQGGVRIPLPVGSLCYTWSQKHTKLFPGYVTGVDVIGGKPARQVKYFGLGEKSKKWWSLDDVFDSVGEAVVALGASADELEVAQVGGRGTAAYQRAAARWDIRMRALEETEVNLIAGGNRVEGGGDSGGSGEGCSGSPKAGTSAQAVADQRATTTSNFVAAYVPFDDSIEDLGAGFEDGSEDQPPSEDEQIDDVIAGTEAATTPPGSPPATPEKAPKGRGRPPKPFGGIARGAETHQQAKKRDAVRELALQQVINMTKTTTDAHGRMRNGIDNMFTTIREDAYMDMIDSGRVVTTAGWLAKMKETIDRLWLQNENGGGEFVRDTIRMGRMFPTYEDACKENAKRMPPGENAMCTFCCQKFTESHCYLNHMRLFHVLHRDAYACPEAECNYCAVIKPKVVAHLKHRHKLHPEAIRRRMQTVEKVPIKVRGDTRRGSGKDRSRSGSSKVENKLGSKKVEPKKPKPEIPLHLKCLQPSGTKRKAPLVPVTKRKRRIVDDDEEDANDDGGKE